MKIVVGIDCIDCIDCIGCIGCIGCIECIDSTVQIYVHHHKDIEINPWIIVQRFH